MRVFRTHQKLLTLLLVGAFFSVPLVTHAFSLSGIIISIVGFFLWIAAGLFDSALDFFVLKMGGLITGSTGIGIGVSIDIIWKIVRDLVNLSFIFGLVYVGFKTILDAGTDTKKLLSSIIIGALLVNFSLFISKVVIDVSNVTASEIYKQMGIGEEARRNNSKAALSTSEAFMAQMGILKLMAPDKATQAALVAKTAGGAIGTTDGYLAFVVGASLFILVASFVFFAGAFLLAIRFGVLVILMMLSPVALAATVFPVFKGWRDKWWHTLFSQAFFAPAYLFMLYVTLKVAEGYATQMGGFDKIFTGTGFVKENFSTAVFFTLTIIIMVASLILAKQMGSYGATWAVGLGNKIRGYATGYAGRNTIGRFADWRLQKREAAGKSSTSILSRMYASGAGAKFGGTLTRAQEREAGQRAGRIGARREQTRAIATAIATGAATPVGSPQRIAMERAIAGASTEQLADMLKGKRPGNAQYDAIVRYMSGTQFDALMRATPEQVDDRAKATLAGARGTAVQDTLRQNVLRTTPGLTPATALQQGIRAASAAQLKALGSAVIIAHAADLRYTQFDDIMKSNDYTDTEKDNIRQTRENDLLARFTAAPAGFLAGLRNDTEVANLPRTILIQPAAIAQVTPGMLAKMQDTLNQTDRATIRAAILPGHPAHGWITSPRGTEF